MKENASSRRNPAGTVLLPVLILIMAILASADVEAQESRIWTSSDGKKIQGSIVKVEGEKITLKTPKGTFTFPLSRLIGADQEIAKKWGSNDPKPVQPESSGGKKPLGASLADVKLGEWPKSVSADFDVDQIQIVKEDKEAGEYIYRSPHFEFRSPLRLSKTVIREFARIFEATFEFARAIPIGLDPQPFGEGWYPTQLYETKEDYYADGGIPGSGGMFSSSTRGGEITRSIIKVPLQNLGVEYTGTRFIVDHKKRSDTLIHEIAHQMTGRWLYPLPVWFTEGLAETISTQRFDSGRFTLTSMDRSIREDVVKRSGNDREFTMVNLERLMTITSQEWAEDLSNPVGGRRNYPSANVLFYYFLRLDGNGDGESLVNYMKAIAEGTKEEEARMEILLQGKTYEEMQEVVAKAWRSAGLRLTFL